MVTLHEFQFELLQLRAQCVAGGDHADRLAVIEDPHVPESPVIHEHQCMPDRLVRIDGPGILRHHFGYARGQRIASLGKHAKYNVALGEDAGQAVASTTISAPT